MSSFTSVLLILLILTSTNPLKNNIIQIIDELLIAWDGNVQLNGFFCTKSDSFTFQKHFSNNYESAIHTQITRTRIQTVNVIDITCARNVANQSHVLTYENVKWIFYQDAMFENDAIFQNVLDNLNVSINVQAYFIAEKLNDLYVYDFFQLKTERILTIYATIKNGRVELENRGNIWRYRRNLHGSVVKSVIVVTDNDTLNHLNDYKNTEIDPITKTNYPMMLHLADYLNASIKFTFQNTWGYKDPITFKWNGLVGDLIDDHAEIGGTPLFLTTERVSLIDYVAMTTSSRSKFVFRQPKLSYVSNIFLLPFAKSVWLALIAFLLIMSVALYVIVYFDDLILGSHNTEVMTQNSLINMFFMTLSAMCQQGLPELPFGIAARVVVISSFFTLFFLYTAYSANIVSLLQTPSSRIRTLEDLLHSRLEFGVHDNIFNHFYFSTASEPIRKAIYDLKVAPNGKPPRFMPMDEGISRMRDGLFAFHFEEGPGYQRVQETFFEHEKCGLKDIQYLQVTDPYIAMKKKSPLRKVVTIGFRRIFETGIQSREVSKVYTKKPRCETKGGGFVSVSLIDCHPAFVALALGIFISLVILTLEMFAERIVDIIVVRAIKRGQN